MAMIYELKIAARKSSYPWSNKHCSVSSTPNVGYPE